jgi:CRP-like cAMP-binding protein
MFDSLRERPSASHTDRSHPPHQIVNTKTEVKYSCSVCPAWHLAQCAGSSAASQGESMLVGDATPSTPRAHVTPARRLICHPKEQVDYIAIVCAGWAVSAIESVDRRRQILSVLLPGDFASIAYLFEPMYGRSIEAVTAVAYRRFSSSDIRAALAKNPDSFKMLTGTWVRERQRLDKLIFGLGCRTVEARIAVQILDITERLKKRGMMSGQIFQFPLRQRHLADLTGSTPVHICRVLGEFHRAGLIELKNRMLTIIDSGGLCRIAYAS